MNDNNNVNQESNRAELPFSGDRLLRIRDVIAKTGLGHTTIYRRIGQGTFPGPVHLGGGTVRWKESDLNAWIAGLPTAEVGMKSAARAGK